MLNWFDNLTFIEFFAVLSAANVAMYVGSWVIVKLAQRVFASRMMNVEPAVVTRHDLLLSFLIVAINIAVGIPGWMLWKAGYIELREPSILATVIDTVIIFIFFDLMMYLLHRMMHIGLFYRMIHGRHHDHIDVNGISFYVMNPAEALGFAVLLIALLMAWPMSLFALMLFVFFNWSYGTMAHSGIPIQSKWLAWCMGDSAFHHRHHAGQSGNYGFFTSTWDRLLGTCLPAKQVDSNDHAS